MVHFLISGFEYAIGYIIIGGIVAVITYTLATQTEEDFNGD